MMFGKSLESTNNVIKLIQEVGKGKEKKKLPNESESKARKNVDARNNINNNCTSLRQ